MKKIYALLIALLLTLSLAGCGRKNDAKNLEIVSHKGNQYVISYCSSKLEFGKIFITIEDEKIVNFYTESNSKYTLDTFQFTVGGVSAHLNKEVVEGKKTTTTFTLDNALRLMKSDAADSEGYEEINDKELVFYVKFVDADKTDDKELDDSYIKITTTCEDLVEFIRNKEVKVKE